MDRTAEAWTRVLCDSQGGGMEKCQPEVTPFAEHHRSKTNRLHFWYHV